MIAESAGAQVILVVEDVEETRDGIEKLLNTDGYRVDPARNEEDAILRASRTHPDLVLISLGGQKGDIIAAAGRIRERARLTDEVPVVIFCSETVAEGTEMGVGRNIYLTRPDNFEQLRNFLHRLLHQLSPSS